MAALLLALQTTNFGAVGSWPAEPQSQAPPVLLGPTPYRCQHDSPFYLYIRSGHVFLENFEDGALSAPGASASTGQLQGPGGLTDSVDCDDGAINGSGTNGRSWFSGSGATGITFTFDAAALGGSLPNAAGIVWTDGAGTTRFEAFDASGASLGVLGPVTIADGSFSGTTAEDHFFGIVSEGGIKAIHISNSSGGIEVDHLQYGMVDVSQFPTTRRHLLLFNSGVADNEVPVAGGAVDPHYRLVTSADPAAPGPNAIVAGVIPDGFWMPNSLGSKWIAPSADQSMGAGNAAGNYEYSITFDLAGFDPATASISGFWSSDDEGLDIVINGSSRNFTVPLFGYGVFHSFTINSGFVPGLNTLTFRLQNGSGPTGLRVELYGTAEQGDAAPHAPVLTSLSPESVPVFGPLTPDGHLLVNGLAFEAGAVVRWNGQDRTTTFINTTQLRITPTADDLRSAGTAQVTVFNPLANAASAALPFRIVPRAVAGIQPPYNADYSAFTLGSIRSLPPLYGGLTFKQGDPDTLIIGGVANSTAAGAGFYAVGVLRDQDQRIVGFSGPATFYAQAEYIDGGVVYGPGGVLFYTRYPTNEIGQIKSGSTMTDKVTLLTSLGISGSPGGLNFVPPGFPGAGAFKVVSFSGGAFYTVDLIPDGFDTFELIGAVHETTLPGGPEGFIYIPMGSPHFPMASMLVSEYSAGQIGAYALDAGGNPMPAARASFMTGLSGAEGAVIDPRTGDFLFSTFGGGDQIVVVRGFAVPPEGPGQADTGVTVAAPAAQDDALVYSAQVGNAGPDPATNVRLDIALTNFRFVGASASQGVCNVVGAQVQCNLGTLAVGAAASVIVTLGPPLSGWASQTYSTSSDQSDPHLENNIKTTTLGERQPPVARAGDDRVVPGHLSQGARVTLDGRASSDPQGQTLTYRWTGPFSEGSGTVFGVGPEVTLPFGQSTVTLVVHDGEQESAPAAVRITVSDFTLSAAAVNSAVRAGEAATYTLTLAPQHGPFGAPIALACSGLPAGAACSFSSASVTPGAGATTVTLTVRTSAAMTASIRPASLWLALAVLPGIVWMLPAARRRRRMALLAVLALAAVHAACGGAPPPPPAATSVTTTSQFVVTGTTGGLTHSAGPAITITR